MSKGVDLRRSELAKIHIAKKELCLDDETYRLMLWSVARVKSASDLDAHGRTRVLEHLKSRGFQGRKKRTYPGRPHNADSNAQIKKIEALLADSKLPWSYADAMAKRICHRERVAFCDGEQLQKIIAALTYNANRKGKQDDKSNQQEKVLP